MCIVEILGSYPIWVHMHNLNTHQVVLQLLVCQVGTSKSIPSLELVLKAHIQYTYTLAHTDSSWLAALKFRSYVAGRKLIYKVLTSIRSQVFFSRQSVLKGDGTRTHDLNDRQLPKTRYIECERYAHFISGNQNTQ